MRRLLPLAIVAGLTSCTALLGTFEVDPDATAEGADGGGDDSSTLPGEDGSVAEDASPAEDAGVDASTFDVLKGAQPLSLTAGMSHTCGLFAAGLKGELRIAACWGSNELGQLGDPNVKGRRQVAVVDLKQVPLKALPMVAIRSHALSSVACMLGSDEEVRCWGANDFGQTGIGMPNTPPMVPGPKDSLRTQAGAIKFKRPSELALGGAHGCAITPGRVHCWGNAKNCQLTGDFGNCGPDSAQMREIQYGDLGSGAGLASVFAAGATSCAQGGGALFCWGSNEGGIAQPGGTPLVPKPVKVLSSDPPHAVSASGSMTFFLALMDDASIWGWGSNKDGVINPGGAANNIAPLPIADLPGKPADVQAGERFACGTFSTGGTVRVACWGNNEQDQLGNGAASPGVPKPLAGLREVQSLAVGARHACVIARPEGAPPAEKPSIFCWGANDSGQAVFNNPAATIKVPTKLSAN